MDEVTRLMDEARRGDRSAASDLLPLIYQELRRLAQSRMRQERAEHTLQATALVHEAYLRLVGDGDADWSNRAHFFHAAAEAMRRILIDHARARAGPVRGGGRHRLPLDVVELASEADPAQILALDEAISRLEKKDPDAGRVVRLRFFVGMSIDEIAKSIGASSRTVKRDWAFARAFLTRALSDGQIPIQGEGRA